MLVRMQDGSTLHFRGLRIYEAVIDEVMERGLANATQVIRRIVFRRNIRCEQEKYENEKITYLSTHFRFFLQVALLVL